MSVSAAIKHACETVGEGPHWDERTGELLFVDIMANDAHKFNPETGKHEKKHFDDNVSLIIPARSGGYVIGVGRKLCKIDWDSGDVTKTYCDVDVGTRNRFNDGKCDPTGRLWAGTMGYEPVPAHPELEMGTLFTLERSGEIKTHINKISISNGMAWTADRKTMYYIDSVPRKVYAFDFNIEKGEISNQRVLIDFERQPIDVWGYPDGMCIDAEDKIWVACYGVGKVIRFDPATGTEMRTLDFPALRTTSCCWGGAHYEDLYVTCGKYPLTEEEFKTKEPLAGSVFKVTGLGVKGLPAPIYED